MLSKEFSERLKEAGYGTDQITCNCLDPGTVNTKMLLAGWGPCGINVRDALGK
jgi:NAD(P)-dependent dehydrogenase (short-subunit alcohol dehydrogenase family)